MHISVICDLDACIYDAGFFRYERTNEPTNKAILGVGCRSDVCLQYLEGFLDQFEMGLRKAQRCLKLVLKCV